jgi:hypothetical protein
MDACTIGATELVDTNTIGGRFPFRTHTLHRMHLLLKCTNSFNGKFPGLAAVHKYYRFLNPYFFLS